MEYGTKVTETLTTMGQVRLEQLQEAVKEGFKSVLNLRAPNELGFLPNEQQMVESLGLRYAHHPLRLECLEEKEVAKVLQTLEQLPRPVLVHCAAGMRSTAIALLSAAINEGLTPQQTVERAYAIGFHHIDNTMVDPRLRERFLDYVARHARVSPQAA